MTDDFIKWLRAKKDFKKECDRLKLKPEELEKYASQDFDKFKHSFVGPHSHLPHVLIYPAPGVGEYAWLIQFDNDDMASFFKPAVDEIITCIDSLITPRTKVRLAGSMYVEMLT